jgi:hypothetical protein
LLINKYSIIREKALSDWRYIVCKLIIIEYQHINEINLDNLIICEKKLVFLEKGNQVKIRGYMMK